MLIPFEVNHFVILQLASTALFPVGLGLVYALMALYLGVMLLDPRRRSVHDFIARTVVTPR